MSHHAEDALRDALRAVEGLGDEEAERRIRAYRCEVLARFTNDLTERLIDLQRAWEDDDGRVLPTARPIFNLVLRAVLDAEDDHTTRTA